jgi:putative hydrolase of the HAD superfamily
MNTKIVWFDFGGVLSPPISDLFISYFLKTGIQPKDLQLAMKHVADDMHMDILSPIEKGILTE